MKTEINGIHYAYDIQGTGEPILLLHGFTGNRQQWADIVADLSSQYTCVTIDLIGHGETDSPADHERYAMEYAANDLIALMAQLDFGTFHLLGYSMGGRFALYIAIHYPQHITSLILESTSPGLKTEEERQQRRDKDNVLADQIIEHGIDWFAEHWNNLPLWNSQKSLPQTTLDALNQQRLQNYTIGLANSLRGMGTGIQPSLWDKLNTLHIPVTLITGELDQKFRNINTEMQKHIPGADLCVIAEAGHNAHLERISDYLEFCNRHLKPIP